jgi:hypothetical protein
MSETTKSVSESVQSAVAKAATEQAYAALVAIPSVGWIFALPVISQFTRSLLNGAIAWLLRETALGLSILWIMIDVTFDVKTAEDMKKKLKDMLENPAKYSAKEQKKIEDDFDESTVNLIQLTIKRL